MPARDRWSPKPWRFVTTARERVRLLGSGCTAVGIEALCGQGILPRGASVSHSGGRRCARYAFFLDAMHGVHTRRVLQQCSASMSACWVLGCLLRLSGAQRGPSGVPLHPPPKKNNMRRPPPGSSRLGAPRGAQSLVLGAMRVVLRRGHATLGIVSITACHPAPGSG